MDEQKKILFNGPLPPPAGGISIHIKRLADILEEKYKITFIDESASHKSKLFNIRSFNALQYWKMITAADLVFVHSGNRLFKTIHILHAKLFRKKLIITLHGYGKERKKTIKRLDSWLYNLSDKIILVNEHISQKLYLNREKTIVKHAFIPPLLNLEPPLPQKLVIQIENDRKAGKCILCGNASRLDRFQGNDLYGLDMILELMKHLTTNQIPAVFYFNVSTLESGKVYFEDALAWIIKNNLQEAIKLTNEPISFVKLIEQSDIMIRPTITDGDSLSIREALVLNKPVITSDVVDRPTGCNLFQNRNQQNLNDLTTNTISKFFDPPALSEIDQPLSIEKINDFYLNLINNVLHTESHQ